MPPVVVVIIATPQDKAKGLLQFIPWADKRLTDNPMKQDNTVNFNTISPAVAGKTRKVLSNIFDGFWENDKIFLQ